MGWTFSFTDMIEAFPTVEPHDKRVKADLNISGWNDEISSEFAIKWFDLANESSPKLEAFCDSWAALDASGILPILVSYDSNKDRDGFGGSRKPRVTIEEMKAELLALGFTDKTPQYRDQGPDRCTCCNGSGWLYKTRSPA